MNNEKTKFVFQVAKVDLVLDIISVCGSIPIEIPILWPRAVMVGPRPRVLLTPPLYIYVCMYVCIYIYMLIYQKQLEK
jgi:hypothetical protein